MGDALQRLALKVTYRTGPLAWSDLHAGGLFFCVVYRECLRFRPDGRVRRWCEVLDDSRPLDDEAERLRATREVGTYRLNDRGYIECAFRGLALTGLPCERAPERLAFHAFRAGAGVAFGMVFTRQRPKRRTRRCT